MERKDMNAVPLPRNRSARPSVSRTTRPPWPINEILLCALVWRRRSDEEIARLHDVRSEDVAALRESYGL